MAVAELEVVLQLGFHFSQVLQLRHSARRIRVSPTAPLLRVRTTVAAEPRDGGKKR